MGRKGLGLRRSLLGLGLPVVNDLQGVKVKIIEQLQPDVTVDRRD